MTPSLFLQVIILMLPATVQNLTETGATNDTFTVEWDKADGDVDFYEISCSEGEPQVQQVSGNIYTASCIGLVPGENYNVTVVANSNGKLGEEQTLNVFTIPSAVQLSEYDATTTSVTAQWTWSEADDGVAELFNVYCESGYPTKTTIYVTVDTLYNATCNNVTPGRNVTIVVSSTSGDKTSDNDTIIISAVPAMIQNLTETSATTNTFTVEWDEADGDVDFYEISCSEGQPDVSGDMYTASCIGLVPGGNYNVKVVANSNGKLGEEQTLNVFTIPSAVQLSEYDATTTSVTAQWTWSEADDGVAEHFNVYCGSGDPTETTIYVTGDTLYNATCNNVTSGRNVTIVVSSTSGDKTSDNDTIIISAVPAMIQNLTETSATTNTFTVEWDEADGDVDFYEISCSEGQPDVSGDMYTASCIGLLPGGNYNVTVVANSNGKLGEEQTLNVFTIPNAVQLSEYDANTTSVTAQWTWSGADDGVAEHFNVYCESGYPTNTTIYVTGETLYNATCNNVTSGRNVTIVVSSTSGDKTSDNDTIIISAVPETVLYLRETSVTNETLTVSWEPPKGDVDFYQISCFENATLQTVEHTNEKTYTAECNKLTPGEEYKIIVTAYSNQKAGEASSITVITKVEP
ncbi:receptor-type tyrosine-protein phosphatase beta-like [Antedon mediterranea]|uniref:receptor-type tyrosine-protein phosphatase beta-like n=1 Tax=Antedon mediterranea TaxID=105859 RepID=UPI003AF5D019